MDLRRPQVVTDGGPWAEHNQACAVCQIRHAILNLSCGVFEPCGTCKLDGWEMSYRRRGWKRRLRNMTRVSGRIDLQLQRRVGRRVWPTD